MQELLDFLQAESDFFIEAEAKPDRMQQFIEAYNEHYNDSINMDTEGIIVLQPDANKLGLELRLYVKSCPPDNVMRLGFSRSKTYRPEYAYRLNSKEIIEALFRVGYRIGIN